MTVGSSSAASSAARSSVGVGEPSEGCASAVATGPRETTSAWSKPPATETSDTSTATMNRTGATTTAATDVPRLLARTVRPMMPRTTAGSRNTQAKKDRPGTTPQTKPTTASTSPTTPGTFVSSRCRGGSGGGAPYGAGTGWVIEAPAGTFGRGGDDTKSPFAAAVPPRRPPRTRPALDHGGRRRGAGPPRASRRPVRTVRPAGRPCVPRRRPRSQSRPRRPRPAAHAPAR